MDRLFAETQMAIQGVRDRLKYATKPSLKTAYRTNRIFLPETSRAFALDTGQDGGSSLVNYVLRDGNTYEIPFVFSGEGVFVARFMKVSIKQRLYVAPTHKAVQLACGYNGRFPGNVAGAWTTKFSIFPKQPGGPAFAVDAWPSVNFYWSMRDNTGWQLSDNLQSHVMLQPNTVARVAPTGSSQMWAPINDGGLYEFDTPWAFERDGQCVFQFRPTTPVLQFDSSIAGTAGAIGLPFDDRESGVRNQAVTVTIALHGSRFLTDRDAMRSGAMTRIRRGEPG